MCRTCPLLHRTDICGVVQRLPRRVSVPQAQVRFLPPLLMKFTAMKILTLIIKQKWFDAILSGEKTVETREVRPTNTKYISYRDNNTGKVYKKDSDVPESAWDSEKGVDTVINHYDAIQFWVATKSDLCIMPDHHLAFFSAHSFAQHPLIHGLKFLTIQVIQGIIFYIYKPRLPKELDHVYGEQNMDIDFSFHPDRDQ